MRIPRYWVKGSADAVFDAGRRLPVSAWGWSHESPAAAEAMGRKRANRLADQIQQQARWPADHTRLEYDYLDQPLREEIVDEIGPAGDTLAVITRNRYGALILNAASALFADIDFPPARARGLWDSLRMAMSPAYRADRNDAVRRDVLAATRGWFARHPSRSARLYRTAAGLRILFTDRTYDPASPETLALLQELGSDPLYIRLTLKQESFRARLTPKPWRCGAPRYPVRFPFPTAREAEAARTWKELYARQAAAYRVCDLITVYGNEPDSPAIQAVTALHDRLTCHPTGATLA